VSVLEQTYYVTSNVLQNIVIALAPIS